MELTTIDCYGSIFWYQIGYNLINELLSEIVEDHSLLFFETECLSSYFHLDFFDDFLFELPDDKLICVFLLSHGRPCHFGLDEFQKPGDKSVLAVGIEFTLEVIGIRGIKILALVGLVYTHLHP